MKHFKGCKKPEIDKRGILISCETCGAFDLLESFKLILKPKQKQKW